jgi:NAD(P)-dependent dehydrogenase (short-subunit alcohol dehydrogenase family)
MAKTWLITGSSHELGRALAEAVAAVGDNVVATARDSSALAMLVDAYPQRLRTMDLDLADANAARRAIRIALDEFRGLDVIVNHAGYANAAALEDTPGDDFWAQFETNLLGLVNLTRAALPIFRQQHSGHFIQFSSIGGHLGGSPGLAAYQLSKFAVEDFAEMLNAEVSPFGVKVTSIEPGAFRSDWGGASTRVASVAPDYDPSVDKANRTRESTVDRWAGDPERAAKIIVDVSRLEHPPLRLLLGAGAVESAERSSRARAAEAAEWADVSRSADLPEGA